MYAIKKTPEDFIVKEIAELSLKDAGDYLIYVLKKRNYTVMRAIGQIANVLRINPKEIGFAGIKDKNAITEQFISIRYARKENIDRVRLKDISLEFKGYSDKPIVLGNLIENEFIITVRDLTDKEISSLITKIKNNKKLMMPNLFGEQRFSEKNTEIGRFLVKCDFENALKTVLETNPDYKEQIEESLERNPKNFVIALKIIPRRLLMLYVHAYQSFLWNMCLEEYTKKNKKNIEIPIVGFGTEIEDGKIDKIIGKIMKKEKINFRSFINRPIPEISPEGSLRNAFAEIEELKILEAGKDFVKLSFKLKKGSYATVAVDFLVSAYILNPLQLSISFYS
ncbi:MAG: tRNA pseudouridine(13) synthase TruD [Nanoarchaeota archaeon]|nr:tRNA pseudouridine(13) synthase TruD [Nanoarchaeota archaeon]MBU1005492.1 tRNA pseudouridine(13) synthase TruD [Nanoarchaeota archaeon]MBU1946836.1 tRNA pseudouridine(13) synthase TruD [Nanoarchaeota archaeon]